MDVSDENVQEKSEMNLFHNKNLYRGLVSSPSSMIFFWFRNAA